MPSRRTLLRTIGTGATFAVAGCLGSRERVEAYVQFKSITGLTQRSGETEQTSILRVTASYEPNNAPPELGHLNEDWADRFPVPRAPTVSDGLHNALTDQFDTIRYVVGTTSSEWAENGESLGSFNVATTRTNFNRVQVHNKVTASSDGTFLTIHSVDGLWNFDSDH
jgi:hypothetical protein